MFAPAAYTRLAATRVKHPPSKVGWAATVCDHQFRVGAGLSKHIVVLLLLTGRCSLLISFDLTPSQRSGERNSDKRLGKQRAWQL